MGAFWGVVRQKCVAVQAWLHAGRGATHLSLLCCIQVQNGVNGSATNEGCACGPTTGMVHQTTTTVPVAVQQTTTTTTQAVAACDQSVNVARQGEAAVCSAEYFTKVGVGGRLAALAGWLHFPAV